jgi:hypothetical protein
VCRRSVRRQHTNRDLEVRFEPAAIGLRVTNSTKLGKLRRQVIPYTDSLACTDRLNCLFTPAGRSIRFIRMPTSSKSHTKKTVALSGRCCQ